MPTARRNDLLIPTLGVLFDALAIEGAFIFSYWIRFRTGLLNFLPLTETKPPLDAYLYGSLVVIAVWLLIFRTRGMYGARRNVSLDDEFFNILKLATLGMLVVMSGAFFYRAFSYSRVVFGLLWVTSVVFIFLGRLLLVRIERMHYRSGRDLRNAVIIGGNETAVRIASLLGEHPLLGYRLVGYLAEERSGSSGPLAGARYLGTLTEAPAKLAGGEIELALIALKHDEHQKLYRLVQECEGLNIEFLMVPDILGMMTSRMAVQEIEGVPFIRIKGVPMTTWGRISKRTFDLVLGAVVLTVCSPLFLIIWLAIRLDSRGPVFFVQKRVGLDGNGFSIVKFRSMVPDAEKETGPVWARQDDPRQTRVGRVLRRLSLDELPQLINVIRGEMSLVGPRPERPNFVDRFKGLVPKYLDRHRVKAGMTGWAQVNGLRGDSSLEERVKYDIYYIENWSLVLDIKILLKTFIAVVRRSP